MIKIVVPGRPVPKQRPRLGVQLRGRRIIKAHVYTPRETQRYAEHVRQCALAAGVKPIDGPVAMEIDLWLYGYRGDASNYWKNIEDALNGVAYHDDRQVVDVKCRIHKARKRTDQRAEIVVRPAGEADRRAG
ncbi:MAG TPA: RusA family crossover junction endodeoxyribonuclease [Calditerricola sp.]